MNIMKHKKLAIPSELEMAIVRIRATRNLDWPEACGFAFKARQFNTFADVVSIYYKGKPRNVLPLDAAQFYTLEKANVPSLLSFIEPIRKTLEGLEKDGTISFTNHYSIYFVSCFPGKLRQLKKSEMN